MPRENALPSVIGAVALFAAALSACSGHQSISGTPARSVVLPPAPQSTVRRRNEQPGAHASASPAPAATASGKTNAPVLRVTDADNRTSVEASSSNALPIVNGSRLQLTLSADGVSSASVRAGTISTNLAPAGEGQWTATFRYNDTANPPMQHGVMEIEMRTAAGQSVLRFPIDELHQ